MTPHTCVPRDPAANLAYRQNLLRAAFEDEDLQRTLLSVCRQDVSFFVSAFCFTFDPRKEDGVLPFATWPYQDDAFAKLTRALENSKRVDAKEKRDILVEKSRDMGASWIICAWMLWRWLFFPHQSFLMVSRKEDLVDGDDDSLFAHLDFMLKRLPFWMRPRAKRIKLKLRNDSNGSCIDGESTTTNIGRGGRRTAILIDEFAAFDVKQGFDTLSATADATRMRIFNSTPLGMNTAFYSQRQAGTPRIRLHWSLHPEKARGLYRPFGDGRVEILDEAWHNANPGYEFKSEIPGGEEKVRSPWYDQECERRAHGQEIASQLDIDYKSSAWPFFGAELLDNHRANYCRPPYEVGRLEITGVEGGISSVRFVPDPKGYLLLWVQLDKQGRPLPPGRDYIAGIDISAGSGSSDSVVSIVDRYSGEKKAEMAYSRWSILEFARLSVALAKFFGDGYRGAHMIWEHQGPGVTYGGLVTKELRYTNVYRHREEGKFGAKVSERYGYMMNGEAKIDLLSTYREALRTGRFINPSVKALDEASCYMHDNDKIEFQGASAGFSHDDPTNQGKNHGDRVIADALACKVLGNIANDVPPPPPLNRVVTPLTYAGRREMRRREAARKQEW